MDVDGTAHVPTGINRQEAGVTVSVGHLVTTEPTLANVIRVAGSAHVGIGADSVAVPDVDVRARKIVTLNKTIFFGKMDESCTEMFRLEFPSAYVYDCTRRLRVYKRLTIRGLQIWHGE